MMEIRNSLLMAVVILFLSCCGPSREVRKPKTKPPETPKIESALSLALVPVADGGIYAVDEVDGVVLSGTSLMGRRYVYRLLKQILLTRLFRLQRAEPIFT